MSALITQQQTNNNEPTRPPITNDNIETLVKAKILNRPFPTGFEYLKDIDIGKWNVSHVTNMDMLFADTEMNATFNEDISDWDVSNVTNMEDMFYGSREFDQDLSKWDVSNVENMCRMFGRTKLETDNKLPA